MTHPHAPKLTQQADGTNSRARSFHQYLKRTKHRADRRYARECVRAEDEPIDTTRRYRWYET
jgi:hypothetical protein